MNDTDKDYEKGAGLVQVVSSMGGRGIRSGTFTQFPFDAAGFSSSTIPASEYGFALVDVTPSRLTVSYTAADDGAVIDSFSITEIADFDGDGDVDGLDLLEWQQGDSPNPLSQTDLADWEANHGTGASPLTEPTKIPEPGGALLVLATVCLYLQSRRA